MRYTGLKREKCSQPQEDRVCSRVVTSLALGICFLITLLFGYFCFLGELLGLLINDQDTEAPPARSRAE